MMFTLLHRSRNHCKTLLWEEKPRAWNKSVHTSKFHGDLPPIGKIDHRFCRKSTTSSTDFGRICHLWGYLSQVLWSSVFGKNMLRFWGEQAPFLGRTGSVFGAKCLYFGENRNSLVDKLVRFLDWLGQSSSLTVLNAKHVWVWIQGFKGGWVSLKRKSTGGKLEGKWLKPINFDIETVFGFVLGTCMRCHKHKLEIHSSYWG